MGAGEGASASRSRGPRLLRLSWDLLRTICARRASCSRDFILAARHSARFSASRARRSAGDSARSAGSSGLCTRSRSWWRRSALAVRTGTLPPRGAAGEGGLGLVGTGHRVVVEAACVRVGDGDGQPRGRGGPSPSGWLRASPGRRLLLFLLLLRGLPVQGRPGSCSLLSQQLRSLVLQLPGWARNAGQAGPTWAPPGSCPQGHTRAPTHLPPPASCAGHQHPPGTRALGGLQPGACAPQAQSTSVGHGRTAAPGRPEAPAWGTGEQALSLGTPSPVGSPGRCPPPS